MTIKTDPAFEALTNEDYLILLEIAVDWENGAYEKDPLTVSELIKSARSVAPVDSLLQQANSPYAKNCVNQLIDWQLLKNTSVYANEKRYLSTQQLIKATERAETLLEFPQLLHDHKVVTNLSLDMVQELYDFTTIIANYDITKYEDSLSYAVTSATQKSKQLADAFDAYNKSLNNLLNTADDDQLRCLEDLKDKLLKEANDIKSLFAQATAQFNKVANPRLSSGVTDKAEFRAFMDAVMLSDTLSSTAEINQSDNNYAQRRQQELTYAVQKLTNMLSNASDHRTIAYRTKALDKLWIDVQDKLDQIRRRKLTDLDVIRQAQQLLADIEDTNHEWLVRQPHKKWHINDRFDTSGNDALVIDSHNPQQPVTYAPSRRLIKRPVFTNTQLPTEETVDEVLSKDAQLLAMFHELSPNNTLHVAPNLHVPNLMFRDWLIKIQNSLVNDAHLKPTYQLPTNVKGHATFTNIVFNQPTPLIVDDPAVQNQTIIYTSFDLTITQ